MSFSDIKGQDKPIRMLMGFMQQARLEGGYLFVGLQGIGKRMVAKTLAKALNCIEESLDSCDRCVSCKKIENNQHPDIHIIDSAEAEINPVRNTMQTSVNKIVSNGIKIEQIRQLQSQINLLPYEGKRKVFIIDNAHRITPEAQGALLKILEEPPGKSLIILISDKPALIFKTITSRCKILKFSPLRSIELKEILKKDYGLDEISAHFLSFFSEGRFGLALKLKDTDIIKEKNRVIDKFVFSRRPSLDNLAMQNRDEVRSCLNILAAWFRDIYLIKIGMPYSEIINLDRKDELLKDMSRFSFLDLNEILDSISNSILYLEQNINIRLLLNDLSENITYGAQRAT